LETANDDDAILIVSLIIVIATKAYAETCAAVHKALFDMTPAEGSTVAEAGPLPPRPQLPLMAWPGSLNPHIWRRIQCDELYVC
jgi:hypothetical protein